MVRYPLGADAIQIIVTAHSKYVTLFLDLTSIIQNPPVCCFLPFCMPGCY